MTQGSVSELVARYGIGPLLTNRVLAVDDEPENLVVLRSFLEPDYEVVEAASGAEALCLLDETDVDVVLTDHRMPQMTGVELLEAVASRRPDVAGIVVTAYTDTPTLLSAINRAQAFRYIRKPWDADDLLSVVAQARDHIQQRRAIARLVELLSARTDALAQALDELGIAQSRMLHLERLSTMGRLASGVTHDLRNALTGLLMVQDLLADVPTPPQVSRMLDVGLGGMRNLLGSLHTLHQFVRDQKLTLATVPVSVADVVGDALAVERFDSAARERTIDARVDEAVPLVLGDKAKLIQVVVNLIRNAVQVTRPSDSIVVIAEKKGADRVIIAVEDDGDGIDASVEGRLFEPFVSTKGDQGMGMGLYMARLIVESHGGVITARNRSPRGARFEIALPVPRRDDPR